MASWVFRDRGHLRASLKVKAPLILSQFQLVTLSLSIVRFKNKQGTFPLAPKPTYHRNEYAARYVREGILNGRTVKSIIDGAIAKYSNVPHNHNTFMRVYGPDIQDARDAMLDKIGKMVLTRAEESDKILELLARSRGDFNPTDKVAVAEVDGNDLDDDSAVKSLMRMLGKDVEDDDGG